MALNSDPFQTHLLSNDDSESKLTLGLSDYVEQLRKEIEFRTHVRQNFISPEHVIVSRHNVYAMPSEIGSFRIYHVSGETELDTETSVWVVHQIPGSSANFVYSQIERIDETKLDYLSIEPGKNGTLEEIGETYKIKNHLEVKSFLESNIHLLDSLQVAAKIVKATFGDVVPKLAWQSDAENSDLSCLLASIPANGLPVEVLAERLDAFYEIWRDTPQKKSSRGKLVFDIGD